MKYPIYCFLLSIVFFVVITSCKTVHTSSTDKGFVQIFDGKTLNGWEGDSVYWRVEDGCLIGEVTPATILSRNSFIIWRGGTTRDFELKVEYKVSKEGNSGINYRSEEVAGLPYALRGYQADIEGGQRYTGINYEERGRTTLADRGEKVELSTTGEGVPGWGPDSLKAYVQNNKWTKAAVTGSLGTSEELQSKIKSEDWNEYHLIVKGNRMQHYINGTLMSDVTDNDKVNRKMEGLLGVQVHIGPPMTIRFRNFRLKTIQ